MARQRTLEEQKKRRLELDAVQKGITARAVSLEEKLQYNAKNNTLVAEDAVQLAYEMLGRATRRYLRLLRKKL